MKIELWKNRRFLDSLTFGSLAMDGIFTTELYAEHELKIGVAKPRLLQMCC
jgi:hypothetical protein